MRATRSVFGIVIGLIPILYCLGFLVYFANVEHFTGVPVGNALGPTVIGLGVVALLVSIPVILRIARLFRTPAPAPDEARRTAQVFADAPGDFDADAAIARYLALRTAADSRAAAAPDNAAPEPGASSPRPGFGRKRS